MNLPLQRQAQSAAAAAAHPAGVVTLHASNTLLTAPLSAAFIDWIESHTGARSILDLFEMGSLPGCTWVPWF
jgi:hypothetical protein